MHFFIYYIVFFLLNPQFYINIEQKNKYIEFNSSMKQADFKRAIQVFERLDAVHRVIDSHLRLSAAHAYFALGDTSKARLNYEYSQDISDPVQSSISRNQLGILALMRGDSSLAINYFKSSIEKNIALSEAKFNYEFISRIYNPKSPPTPLSEEQNDKVEVSDQREQDLGEYTSENISKERALQLLDNLRISERKGLPSVKNSKGKIEKDW
jgi:hypothetical protein